MTDKVFKISIDDPILNKRDLFAARLRGDTILFSPIDHRNILQFFLFCLKNDLIYYTGHKEYRGEVAKFRANYEFSLTVSCEYVEQIKTFRVEKGDVINICSNLFKMNTSARAPLNLGQEINLWSDVFLDEEDNCKTGYRGYRHTVQKLKEIFDL